MQLSFLLPHIDNTPHQTYVEPYGGSAAILLNKNPSPVEVYNDIFTDVVNFFKVLRNPSYRDQLIHLLNLTPYSRQEFIEALDKNPNDPDIEKARKFFVVSKQVTGGMVTTASPGRWGYAIKDSRRNMALTTSRWLSSIPRLVDVADRLKEVQIENLDAKDIIKRYDTPNTLHYLDPPYLMETRSGGRAYKNEMSVQDHGDLLDLILSVKGKVIISGYDNKLYNSRLSQWNKVEDIPKIASSLRRHQSSSTRTDVIWKNY